MIRSIGVILSGNLASAALMMIRTLLVSRLISVEDFGIASIFLLALAMIEMMSSLGLHQQIVQSTDGNTRPYQAALQGFSVLRGAVNAAILLALAGPLCWFFAVPDALWAFQLIALAPLCAGFIHFDAHRLSRRMEFTPAALLVLLPPVGSVLSVLPLYHFFGDYRVLLFAILIQLALSVIVSHAVSKRRYQLRFDPRVILRSMQFGWPLMASGALMFLVFNGERAIIGHALGLETLALFSMALSLTLTPALVVSRSTMSFFLPQLSAAKGTRSFPGLAIAVLQSHILLGCGMVAAIAMLGEPFLTAVLGQKYAAALPFLVWLAVLQAFRVFEGGCAITALAAGHTKNEMMANIVRVALLPIAWVVVAHDGDVMSVIWIGIAGEAAGFAIGLSMALGKLGLALRPLLAPLAFAISLLLVACLLDIQGNLVKAFIMFFGLISAMALTMTDLHAYFRANSARGYAHET